MPLPFRPVLLPPYPAKQAETKGLAGLFSSCSLPVYNLPILTLGSFSIVFLVGFCSYPVQWHHVNHDETITYALFIPF